MSSYTTHIHSRVAEYLWRNFDHRSLGQDIKNTFSILNEGTSILPTIRENLLNVEISSPQTGITQNSSRTRRNATTERDISNFITMRNENSETGLDHSVSLTSTIFQPMDDGSRSPTTWEVSLITSTTIEKNHEINYDTNTKFDTHIKVCATISLDNVFSIKTSCNINLTAAQIHIENNDQIDSMIDPTHTSLGSSTTMPSHALMPIKEDEEIDFTLDQLHSALKDQSNKENFSSHHTVL